MSGRTARAKEKHVHQMASKTENMSELIERLVLEGIVTTHERSILQTPQSHFNKCCQLYLMILQKGPDAYDVMCRCLRETGNREVADILQAPMASSAQYNHTSTIHRTVRQPRKSVLFRRSKTEVEEDVVITETMVPEIVKFLESTMARSNRQAVIEGLLEERERHVIEALPATSGFKTLFRNTLQTWVRRRRSGATLNELLRLLHSKGHDEAVDFFIRNHSLVLTSSIAT